MDCYHLSIKKAKGYARIENVLSGITRFDCSAEDSFAWHPTHDFAIQLGRTGTRFGSCLFDDHWGQFHVMGGDVLVVLLQFAPDLVYYNVNIIEPVPNQYKGLSRVDYYTIDYRQLTAVNYDLSKYPYSNAWICPDCNSTREDTEDFFADISNGCVKPRPFNAQAYHGDDLFRVECFGLGCSARLKRALEEQFSSFFSFERLLFAE